MPQDTPQLRRHLRPVPQVLKTLSKLRRRKRKRRIEGDSTVHHLAVGQARDDSLGCGEWGSRCHAAAAAFVVNDAGDGDEGGGGGGG